MFKIGDIVTCINDNHPSIVSSNNANKFRSAVLIKKGHKYKISHHSLDITFHHVGINGEAIGLCLIGNKEKEIYSGYWVSADCFKLTSLRGKLPKWF